MLSRQPGTLMAGKLKGDVLVPLDCHEPGSNPGGYLGQDPYW